ncbi:MAG: S9 family peptidase [Actinomycetota bacterium]
MERDLRATPLYQEVEALFRSVLEPGFGSAEPAGDPVPSPDGRRIAFRGERLDRLEGHPEGRICVATTDGGDVRQVTEGPHDDADPRWSPDGHTLTFHSDRAAKGQHQLYALDADFAHEPRALATLPGTVEWHVWTTEGLIVAGIAGGAAEQADALGSGTLGGESDLPAWIPEVESSDDGDAERRTLWIVDPATGESRRVSRPGTNVWEANPCGPDAVVAVISDGAGEDAWYGASVALVNLDSGETRHLLSSDVQLGWVAGSPGGRHATAIEAICSDRLVVCGDLRLIEIVSGKVRPIPLPEVDASRVRWTSDQRFLVFGRRGLDSVVLDVTLPELAVRELWSSHGSLGELYDPSGWPLDDGFTAVVTSHDQPPAIIAVDGAGSERVVATTRHAGHDVVERLIGRHEVLRWRAPDGLEIEGLLATPPGKGPFPTVMAVHGGPIGAAGDRFPGAFTALLLSRGFAIFSPNPRGSSGRGQPFALGVVGDMGGQDLFDDLAGLDALVAAGVADPDRLVLIGGSYGGFMAAWIPTQDGRFKASVAISPVTDWWSERFDSSLGSWVGDFLGGQPADIPTEYSARSPVLHAGRVTTPVLLTAGRNDRATPVGQAVEFYRALREHGVPTEVVKYPQEGHGVGDFPALLDLSTRTIAWFERFLPPFADSR